MKMLQMSVRICHQPHKEREIKREMKGTWRSRRCWCSTWETWKHFPYKWNKQYLSSTTCCIWKQLQVDVHFHCGICHFTFPNFWVDFVYMKFIIPCLCVVFLFCLKLSKKQCSFVWRCTNSVLPTLSVEWGRCCLWCGQRMLPLKMLSFKPTDACTWTRKETQSGLCLTTLNIVMCRGL